MADDQDIPIPLASLPRGYLNPSTQALGKYLAPNLTDYLMSPRSSDPQAQVLPSGKISSFDPRMPGVLSDVGMLGTLPLALEGAPELLGARAASSAAPSIAERAAAQAQSAQRQIADLASNVSGGAVGGAGALAATPASGGEIEGVGERPTATDDEQKRLAVIDKQVSTLNAARAKATKDLGPKGAAIQAKSYDDQVGALQSQAATINNQIAARQNEWDKQKAEFDKQTAPFAVRHPDITNVGRAAGLALSPLTGAWLGRKIGQAYPNMGTAKRLTTYGSAGLGGALEGGLGAYLPTLEDVGMPEGAAAKTQADVHNADPRFWGLNVLPEAGAGAVASMLGSKYGLTSAIPKANLASALVNGRLAASPSTNPVAMARAQHAAGTLSAVRPEHLVQRGGGWVDSRTGYWTTPPSNP